MITNLIWLFLWVASVVVWWHCLCDLAAYDKYKKKKKKDDKK